MAKLNPKQITDKLNTEFIDEIDKLALGFTTIKHIRLREESFYGQG